MKKYYQVDIIPKITSAGDRALAQQVYKALYLNYIYNQSVEKLEHIAEMFMKAHPKRVSVIEQTAKHFAIVSQMHYKFKDEEYNLALETFLETEL